jgi:hypothetical protein
MNEEVKYFDPPWITFHRGDGMCDILPAMRQGVVLENVPAGLAAALCLEANKRRPSAAAPLPPPETQQRIIHKLEALANFGAGMLTALGHPVISEALEDLIRAALRDEDILGGVNAMADNARRRSDRG